MPYNTGNHRISIGSLVGDGFYGKNEILPSKSKSEAEVSHESRVRAMKYIATHAKDAQDCAILLDILGLNPEEVYDL